MMEKLPTEHGDRFSVDAFCDHHQIFHHILRQGHVFFSVSEQFAFNTSNVRLVLTLILSRLGIFADEGRFPFFFCFVFSKFSFRQISVHFVIIFFVNAFTVNNTSSRY
jgi:hypothetical protein